MSHQSDHTTLRDDATGALSPDEAQRQLTAASTASIGSRRDATVHGLATAGLGLLVGAYVAASELVDGREPWDDVVVAGYVLLLIALGVMQRRTHAKPRHTGSLVGWAAVPTVLLAFAAIFVMNAWGHSEPVAPGYLVLAAVVVAAPMVIAGATILRRSHR